ncbi:MAG: DUF4197 domain-containing protein [Alphaproteobacteria bacterium]
MMNRKKHIFLMFMGLALLLSVPATAQTDFLQNVKNGLLSRGSNAPAAEKSLTNGDIVSGLKDALRVGTETVVSHLGKRDGFNLDPKIHIPLPGKLQKVDKALTAIGMGRMTDDLELRINRAAEMATPKAKQLFINSIRTMTVSDARSILSGPDDAATQYLKKTMSPELAKEIQPLIKSALAESGAIKSYDSVMGQYDRIPLVSGVKENLSSYVVNKTMDGIFYYVAQEEASIRNNPAKRTTDILKKVFSGLR